jgi:uncharacterized protein involved in cysteine biosynthesis
MAPFRGGALIARHRLWHFLVAPVLLGVALAGVAAWGAVRFWRAEPWMSRLLEESPPLGWIAVVFFSSLVTILLFLVAQPIVNAVFADRLSERIERELRGVVPEVPFLASTGRALVHGILKLVLYAATALLAWALTGFLLGIGAAVSVMLASVFLSYDGFDYPLSRRGASFGKKWAYLALHPGQTIGFGLGATLLYLIPFALFVAPSFVAAGATAVFVEGGGDEKVGKKDKKQNDKKDETKGLAKGEGEGGESPKKPAGI